MTEREQIVWAALDSAEARMRRLAGEAEATGSGLSEAQAACWAEGQALAAPQGAMAGETVLRAVSEAVALSDTQRAQRWGAGEAAQYGQRVTPLSLDEGALPLPLAELGAQNYGAWWQRYEQERARLPQGGATAARIGSRLALLHKYAWCVPSERHAGVSLYDHTRTAAALAACLWEARDVPPDEGEFRLIEGGVSGIQSFIYQPAFNGQELQDGMARRLRGRSFYVALLTRTLADVLIERLGLDGTHLLWATGGHYLIVAPNTADVRERLAAAQGDIQNWLWREWRGALGYVATDAAATRDDLRPAGWAETRARLDAALATAKLQQFNLPLAVWGADAEWVWPMADGLCRDTGRDLTADELAMSDAAQRCALQAGERVVDRSPQSLLFDATGRTLLTARSMQLRRSDDWLATANVTRLPRNPDEAERLDNIAREVLIEFTGLGRTWLLTDRIEPEADADLCLRIGDHRNVLLDFLSEAADHGTAERGFMLLADAVMTKDDGQSLMEFSQLAQQSNGAAYLGALRMDVDDLGRIFAQGFAPEERSLAQLANLSQRFDWFFTGYLNTLVAGQPLYTTYAGGDDLFIVGAWDAVLEAAERIQQQFTAFVGAHPDLHISGGLALCRGKYPLGHAADDAGEKLDDLAKTPLREQVLGDTDKNALAVFERKISWAKWREVKDLGDAMVAACDARQLSRKFVHQLLELYHNHIDPLRHPDQSWAHPDLIWLPRFKFSVVRNVNDAALRGRLLEEVVRHKDYLSILASYVALRTRKRAETEAA